MTLDITYRYYQQGDEEGIVQLLNHSFKGWPKLDVDPISYWKWKYVDNPYWMNDIVVALAGDEIIGCKHSVYFKLKLGDKIIFCTLGSDMAVRQDYRGGGVSKELSSMSSEKKMEFGYPISYSVTSNPIRVKKKRGVRGTFPHDVVVYVLIKDVDKQVDNIPMKRPLLKKIAYKGATAASRFSHLLDEKHPYTGAINRVKGFDEKMDRLWEKAAHHYDFAVCRDAWYLNWRYTDPRAGYYETWVAEEEDQAVGFCVVNVNQYLKHYPIASVMDIFCTPDRGDVMSALLENALKFFHGSNCNIITALAVRGSPFESALSTAGFLNSREKLNVFLGRNVMGTGDGTVKETIEKCTPRTLHFCYGDIDSLPTNI